MFGSDMKDSDWSLSERDLGRRGGMAHVCPVSEEDQMAAANADLWMEKQNTCEERQALCVISAHENACCLLHQHSKPLFNYNVDIDVM